MLGYISNVSYSKITKYVFEISDGSFKANCPSSVQVIRK